MDPEETGSRVTFVLHDRDRPFHEGLDAVSIAAGVQIVRSGIRVPRMNTIMERWIGTCRRELLDRTPIWNIPHPRRILAAYERHDNEHRPHHTRVSAAPLTPLPCPGHRPRRLPRPPTRPHRRNHPRIPRSRQTSP